MRGFRRTHWLVWGCITVLVIQLVAAFGHHRDHSPISTHDFIADAYGHVHTTSAHSEGEAGHEHEDHHDDGDSCDICLSLRTLSTGLLPDLSAPVACEGLTPVVTGCATRKLAQFRPERANLPRAPPLRPFL